jgi:hypothetical protein
MKKREREREREREITNKALDAYMHNRLHTFQDTFISYIFFFFYIYIIHTQLIGSITLKMVDYAIKRVVIYK